jgi:heat shock protein HtpX
MIRRPAALRPAVAPLDPAEQRRHRRRNQLQSAVLLGGMVGLLALCGLASFGVEGLVGMALGGALALSFSPTLSPTLVLRLYRARPIEVEALPELHRILTELTRRAELTTPPRLFYVPSSMLNAFAVGGAHGVAIALTDGLLRALTPRELTGVLAHEISHVRNGDLRLMGLADLIGRLTRLMTLLGLALLVVGLPLWLVSASHPPWLLIPLLLLAPQLAALLQMALSRAREYDADVDAAGLTGDPIGLALALAKLEQSAHGFWERLALPGDRLPEPSLLRTHPPTAERIARLRALVAGPATPKAFDPLAVAPSPIAFGWPSIGDPPRRHWIGFWH